MIYENDNRETGREPDLKPQAQQEEALEKGQRKQFSHVGFTAAAFMLITLAAQLLIVAAVSILDSLVGDTIDFYSSAGRLLMSAIPMYLVAFPICAGLIQLIPKCGVPQREQWGFGRIGACFIISMGIGLAGNIVGQLIGLLEPGGSNAEELDQILVNSSMWLNLLVTVILAPVVEELFYRKLVMDRLLGYGQKAAVIMSGLMFGMAHGNFSQFFYAFGIGLLWAYIYAKTGKVSYTIGFHMLFNLIGGVFTVELSKELQGISGPWVIMQMQRITGMDLSWLITALSALTLLVYLLCMAACLIATVTLLIIYRRQITFQPGQWPLRKGRALRTAMLNIGMILYFLICCGMFVLNW